MKASQTQHGANTFHVGQNIDVLDSVAKWMNAEVIFVGNGTVYVHYTGWSAKYDQSINIDSPRIMSQWQPGKTIKVNNRIDVYHQYKGWIQARVLQIGEETPDNLPVFVHYFNYHKKYDTWVNLKDTNLVAIIGSRSKAFGMGKKRCKSTTSNSVSELIKKLLEQRAKTLKKNLQLKGLALKKSGGDGNCLFRSISDQLYGNQEHYSEIRKICMDYITYQKDFFSDYVIEDIDEYIQRKKQDGEWGDDIEIQAISEIYSRPIEIYVFGQKPIRTFHEQNDQNVTPIRLAYVGSCHYDSIKPIKQLDEGLMSSKFGQFQQVFISTYKEDMMSIKRNRNLFSNCNRLEDTIGEQLLAENRDQVKIQDELAKILEVSETQAILEQIQKSQLNELQNKIEQERIQQQIKKIEQKQIEQAIKMSKKENEKENEKGPQKPYWFDSLVAQGFEANQIWFAIQVKGYDPDAVQNFLLDGLLLQY